jgi:hypothetical protein
MANKKKIKPPKAGVGDAVHAIVRAGLSSIPTIGGPAAELFSFLITPSLEKRRQEWMEEVSNALKKLEREQGVKLEELKNNDVFIDAIMQASQAALRNSQQEKRQALRNAVLNAALPSSRDTTLNHIFINLVDTFTDLHLSTLKLLHTPAEWFTARGQKWPGISLQGMSSIEQAVMDWVLAAFPELSTQLELPNQIIKDLANHGLIKMGKWDLHWSGTNAPPSCVTPLGEKLLRFIEEP